MEAHRSQCPMSSTHQTGDAQSLLVGGMVPSQEPRGHPDTSVTLSPFLSWVNSAVLQTPQNLIYIQFC